MRIRYGGKLVAIALALLAMGALTIMGYLFVLRAVDTILLMASVASLASGVLLLQCALRGETYISVEADRFVIHAMLGPIKRTFRFASWNDVEYAGGKLWVTFEGCRKQVPVHRAQADGADWMAFDQYLRERVTA